MHRCNCLLLVMSLEPSDQFCYLKINLVKGRHHFWDENLGHVWSRELVEELGDVLPKEFVFVPAGVTG